MNVPISGAQGSANGAAALPTLQGRGIATTLHNPSSVWRRNNNPTLQAVLLGNTLSSCDQVESLYHECMTAGSDDMICSVAMRAFSMCTKGYIEADASDANKILLRNTD